MKLLEIQSSARQQGSVSRLLSQEFIDLWTKHRPAIEYKQRDVGTHPPAHLTELWTKANYISLEQRTPEMITALQESEELIEELLSADRLLLGIPMYNFSVPSTFKAYIDNVVRIDRTFSFDRQNYTFQGLITGTKALVITPSAGQFTPGTALGQMNFCQTYLRSLLNFIGIEDVNIVPVPNQFMSDEIRQQEIETARIKLTNLAANW